MRKRTWLDRYHLAPALPDFRDLEPLRDLALDVLMGSRALEAMLAPETASILGERIRLFNSIHSNKIEGQQTTFREIESGLAGDFCSDPHQRYPQELGTLHVIAEQTAIQALLTNPNANVSTPTYIANIHASLFSSLSTEFQFTHAGRGFTNFPLTPGTFRDRAVGIRGPFGTMQLGPATRSDLLESLETFGKVFDPANFHGEAKIFAAAVGHLKLAWLHPFRDGNGRTVRLYTTCFMARCGVNRSNLWSLSRGMSVEIDAYMRGLLEGNPQPLNSDESGIAFMSKNMALHCERFLTICKEQIDFMLGELNHRNIAKNIDHFASRQLWSYGVHRADAGKLLRVVFTQGKLERKEAYEVLSGINPRSAQRIINGLIDDGLLTAKNHKAPIMIALPAHALEAYFPNLCTTPWPKWFDRLLA